MPKLLPKKKSKYNSIKVIQNLNRENFEDKIFERGPVVAIYG
jgi:hypothetical protein